MKISYNWLKQYLDFPFSPKELVEVLTMGGLEVEGVEQLGNIPDGIIVAEILERNPHPDADKLSVCRVTTGTEELQIVCGAPNCDAGTKAPLAMIGTVFVDPETGKDFPIKKCKLRGVESFGMLCSGKELGIDSDHNGIMSLGADSTVGTKVDELIPQDTIYDLEVTPNRPDWLSHWGVARDLAAFCDKQLSFPEINHPDIKNPENSDCLVKIDDYDLCPRYTGRIIRNIQVGESPDWLKKWLLSIGLRPINNIVDITNFVLHELGHPLHAFDLDLLEENRIIVRRATKGEKIIALDEKEYELTTENLVIADAKKPVALGGVMGGEHSGVEEKTVNILLESAAFNPSNIRTTSRDLGISSDSSYRFERGIDYEMVNIASNRATALILELAGGELTTELVDVYETRPELPPPICCSFNQIKKILGLDLENPRIVEIFQGLGLEVTEINQESCQVKTNSYRLDLLRQADLAEEVARVHGLDKIPELPIKINICNSITEDASLPLQNARNELISLGLFECVHYSFVDEKTALVDSRFSPEDLIKLSNPISIDSGILRPSVFSELLNTVKRNISRKNLDCRLFEISNVFCGNSKLYPEERLECGIALTGREHPERFSGEREEIYDFFDLKGLIETWFEYRKLASPEFKKIDDGRFTSGVCSEILIDNHKLGVLGQISPSLATGIRTVNPIYLAIIDLDSVLAIKSPKLYYQPISPYPAVNRDVAFVADETLEHREVIDFILGLGIDNLEQVELFDIFRDESIGEGKKSLAYSLTFRNPGRTLTDQEVNSAHEQLREKLAAKLKIELR